MLFNWLFKKSAENPPAQALVVSSTALMAKHLDIIPKPPRLHGYQPPAGKTSIYDEPKTRFVKPTTKIPDKTATVVIKDCALHSRAAKQPFIRIEQARSGIISDLGDKVVYQAQTGINIGAGLKRRPDSLIQKDLRRVAGMVAMRASPRSPQAQWSPLVNFSGTSQAAQQSVSRQLHRFGIHGQGGALRDPSKYISAPSPIKWLLSWSPSEKPSPDLPNLPRPR